MGGAASEVVRSFEHGAWGCGLTRLFPLCLGRSVRACPIRRVREVALWLQLRVVDGVLWGHPCSQVACGAIHVSWVQALRGAAHRLLAQVVHPGVVPAARCASGVR